MAVGTAIPALDFLSQPVILLLLFFTNVGKFVFFSQIFHSYYVLIFAGTFLELLDRG